MDYAIITALITGGVTLTVCLINNFFQLRATEKKHNETITLINYKLDELTKRVDKHNNVVERTYCLEKRVDIEDEKIKVINHRIEDLKEEVHEHEQSKN